MERRPGRISPSVSAPPDASQNHQRLLPGHQEAASVRVTRSSARLAADLSATGADQPLQPESSTSHAPSGRKRKARSSRGESTDDTPEPLRVSPAQRTKRQRLSSELTSTTASTSAASTTTTTRSRRAKAASAMSNTGSSSLPEEVPGPSNITNTGSSKRKSGRDKKVQEPKLSSSTSSRRSKKGTKKADNDVHMKDTEEATKSTEDAMPPQEQEEENPTEDEVDDAMEHEMGDDDDDLDPFGAGTLMGRRGPPGGLSSTLRALSGMMSGMSSRLREILANLKRADDPSIQFIALQELSEILLVSTEDNLSGHFSPDQFVKELVTLMQPSEFGDENPEMMLLACRCLANLMEALPASTANVVYGGAVPVLCQKLLEIHYIDVAEQALSTLEKISVEFPASIVREGGLTACLTYLDFFATSTQRTAVTTAANCCRNIPEDSFPVVRDVMPILLGVLSSSDQRVVEQGCLCVSRIVESFRYRQEKLEELVSTDILRAVIRLLLPGTTNLIGPNIHTQFLRVLAITARASPRLSVELFKMNIVDTLYQILTGVSPPSGTDDVASKIDSVVIMQALIHRPRDQIFETLNVICELLPGLPSDGAAYLDDLADAGYPLDEMALPSAHRRFPNQKRLELLEDCKSEVRRFAIILFPTLTDAYSSTVNLSVRQKVLTAQLKMLSNLDTDILEDALRAVPYASYLSSILSQQDHPTLVSFALQATELLLKRLESIYRYQFYREGVIAEVGKLATSAKEPALNLENVKRADHSRSTSFSSSKFASGTEEPDVEEQQDEKDEEAETSDDDNEEHDPEDIHDDGSASPSSSSSDRNYPLPLIASDGKSYIGLKAKRLLDSYESNENGREMRDKAARILQDLRALAEDIRKCYQGPHFENGFSLFTQLADHFDGDAIESITSAELLNSQIVHALLDVFNDPDEQRSQQARGAFLEVFMGTSIKSKTRTTSPKSPSTPFSVLVHKLQDLLSRAEHFEVVTVHHNSFDSNRSSATSMLAKQLRLKLVADDESQIPKPYRNIMVSIHAIATFKALDDYLRPRISLSERPRTARHREGISALAALAAATGIPNAHQRLLEKGLSSTEPARSPLSHSADTTPRPSRSVKTNRLTSSAAAQSTPDPLVGKSRRSNRRQSGHSQTPVPPPPPPPPEPEPVQDPLECADERQLSDDEDADDGGALDAIVDDLDEEMTEENPSEVSAVNMEVASSGKVTARKEDGTRVATPSHTPSHPGRQAPHATSAVSQPSTSATQSMPRPMSYAAAIQSVPQDWHIEFSIGDEPIANETTIYRAVHFNRTNADDPYARNVWSAVHTIKFKRASGPPPVESNTLSPPPEPSTGKSASGLPMSLDMHPTTSIILRLLSILHALNANLDDVVTDGSAGIKLNAEPLTQFVNTKLTAKLNRQLEEPLIVASNCLPSWSQDLARLYPFLFPFETRHLFLQSTSFGYSRSMTRWQNSQSSNDSRQDRYRDERPFLGRLQRQKVRISRTRILESAVKVMELYGASPSILEVEYFEEVGTGLGPTLEFYSTVSREFAKKKLKLWRENDSSDASEFAFGKGGLFPAPMNPEQAQSDNGKKILHLFKMLGKFVARSMLDSRIIDVPFNPIFFRIDDVTAVSLSLGAVKSVDTDLARSLKLLRHFSVAKKRIDEDGGLTAAQKVKATSHIEIQGVTVEDLGLDFTLPGYPSIELLPNGSNINVTIDNVGHYVDRVIDMTLRKGVQKQAEAFRNGFSQVFPYSALRAFTPEELVMLFGRMEEDWSLETLMDSIKADHGFNMDSKSVKNLLQTMSELSVAERRDFLQFVTGSPKLPIGGFKSLTPMFTVVCKPSEPPYTSDDYLPSVMTCVNYLKLPDYSTLEIMTTRLKIAIKEGQGAFHLS